MPFEAKTIASTATDKSEPAKAPVNGVAKMSFAAFAMYVVSLLISGSNGIVASNISISSSEIVFFRMMLGAAFLAIAFFATKRKLTVLKNKRDLIFLSAAGAALACEMLFIYEAYRMAGVGMSTILCYLAPIVVMVLSPMLFHERLTMAKGASFAVVVVGSLLINIFALRNGAPLLGIACGLASAAGLAAMVILNKKVTETPGLERALVQLVSASIVVAFYVAFTKGLPQAIADASAAGAWPTIVIIGALAALGNLLYFSAIGKLPVQSVAVCGYLEPLSAVLMSVFILGEHMLALQAVGAALIIGGALFGEVAGKEHAKKAKPVVLKAHIKKHAA